MIPTESSNDHSELITPREINEKELHDEKLRLAHYNQLINFIMSINRKNWKREKDRLKAEQDELRQKLEE